MKSITMGKFKLITILEENREAHKLEFEQAMLQFRKALRNVLGEKIYDCIESPNPKGEISKILISFPQPESHLEDYDRALRMLNSHDDEQITVDAREYRELVEDEWDWSGRFKAATSNYK